MEAGSREEKTTAFTSVYLKEGESVPRIKDISGQKFNRLTVVERAESRILPSGVKSGQWLCRCDCGRLTVVNTSHLISGHTKSCGCYAKEKQIENGQKTKHGLTYSEDGKVKRIYRIWSHMKTRCFNSNDDHFKDYGGRGITMCDEWKDSFQAFYDYVSQLPHYGEEGYSIDRINNDGNYEPGNVKWSTAYEQTNNRRNTIIVEFGSKNHTLAEWSKITGICYQTLFARYKAGKTSEEILKV